MILMILQVTEIHIKRKKEIKVEILEDLKKTIDLDYGVKLHPRYVEGVHEEQFEKDKKEIESIYGVKFPQDYYDSFFVLNGIYNFDGLSLFSLDAIEEDNNNYIDTLGNSDQNYILVGKSSYDLLVYDVDNKGFGVLSFSELLFIFENSEPLYKSSIDAISFPFYF